MTVHRRRGGPDVPMEQWVMAAKEELYAKVTPRRQRQNRPNTIKHGSTLDVLLSMGFPKTRAWVYAASHTAHTVELTISSLSKFSFICLSASTPAADQQHLCSWKERQRVCSAVRVYWYILSPVGSSQMTPVKKNATAALHSRISAYLLCHALLLFFSFCGAAESI